MSPQAASLVWLVVFVLAAAMVGRAEPELRSASTGEILRARGFIVEVHYLTTSDNYRLRLTRIVNPYINGGKPGGLANRRIILFVHGILEAENVFVVNLEGVVAKDLASQLGESPGELSEAELRARLAGEPSAQALPLLASNLGYDCWLLSRRGFPGSQELIGDPLSIKADEERTYSFVSSLLGLVSPRQVAFSFDSSFWNFSLDEQAARDFPECVELVLQLTGKPQLSVVAHSAGGAIALMALSSRPQLAAKISSAIFWSQGFSLGHGDVFNLLLPFEPLAEAYIGSVPPASTTGALQSLAGLFCRTPYTQRTLCELVADLALGPSGGREPMKPQYIGTLLFATSSHELAQNLQMVARGGQMHRFDYGLPQRNLAAYGQLSAPAYNASAIRLRSMSFYVGATDTIVSPADVMATLPPLTVPYEFHYINTTFNHNGYFYHVNASQLVIINSLHEIELLARRQ